MGMSEAWQSVLGALPFGYNIINSGRINEGLAAQQAATDEARGYMNQQLEDFQGMNEPLIKMGDEQLSAIRNGIRGGAFLPDESVFQGYQPYIFSNYTPQSMFQYDQNAPQFQGPAAVQYDQSGMPTLGQAQPFNINSMQELGQGGPGQYHYNQYQYQGPQAPQQVQYSQNQFSPYQQTEQQPQQYTAPNAPGRDYWSPEQFNIGNDPVFRNAVTEGNRAIEASAAAKGMQLSGANLKDLQSNAVNLANRYGQEAFDRYTTQQGMQQGAQNYQGEDVYNRYLNEANIRNLENQQGLGQYNINREFGQGAANQNLANALAVQGQNYGQYAGNRGMGLNEFQTNLGGQQFEVGTNLGQYNTTRDFAFDVNQAQNANDLARYAAQTGQFNQNLQNQLATQGQAWQQAYQPYTTALGQYNLGNQFDYGIYGDYGNQLFNAYQSNTANSQLLDATRYQALQDAYNRQAGRGTTAYDMMSGLANTGLGARQTIGNVLGDYYGAMGDLSLGMGNATAAAAAAKSQNSGLLSFLGL